MKYICTFAENYKKRSFMAKTIEQLAEQANIIQTAIRQGENTAERVGGLFSDIVDYLSAYKGSDIKLGPLLSALNDPTLINPEDGQTLSFSITKEGWKFDDALTELKVSDRRIEQLVSSNYQQFINTKNEFEQDMYAITGDLNQKYADFDSYRIQTDQYIDQWCVAYDEHGNKVSTSRIYQTTEEIQTEVTDNKEAADAAFNNLDNVVIPGINGRLDDVEEESGNNATWIYQNKDRIALVAAQFDDEGNLINTSGLVVEDDFASLFSTQVDEQGVAHTADLDVYVDYDKDTGVIRTGIKMNADEIIMTSSVFEGWFQNATIHSSDITFDVSTIEMLSNNISIKANQVSFTGDDTFDWTVTSSGNTIFHLDHDGNLEIAGQLKQCQIIENVTVGTVSKKIVIEPSDTGAKLVGYDGSTKVMSLGFDTHGGSTNEIGLSLGKSDIREKDGQFYYGESDGLSSIAYRLRGTSSSIEIYNAVDGVGAVKIDISASNGKALISAVDYSGTSHAWPTSSSAVGVGGVYVDNGYLKVKTS